jgi:mannose-6-phosphate isomerase-like protein (cupin superfamily)
MSLRVPDCRARPTTPALGVLTVFRRSCIEPSQASMPIMLKGSTMSIRTRLSRRHTVRVLGVGSLAAIVEATDLHRRLAAAQAPTPTPAYAAGVTAEILGRIEPPAAPGYALQLARITFAPGAAVAAHRHSGTTVTTELTGSHAFTVLQGNARLIRAGTGTPTAGAEAGEPMELGHEYMIEPGDALVFDESVVHTSHNPTDTPAVLMEAQLRATDHPLTEFIPELATPVG